MSLFRYYTRVFFRSHFRPIDAKIAKKWEFNTTMIYFISAWTVFGFAVYGLMNNDRVKDTPLSKGLLFDPYESVKRFSIFPQGTIYTVTRSGIQKETFNVADSEEEKK